MSLKTIKIYSGRVAQLKRPIGNNQQVRASDFNPVVNATNAVVTESAASTAWIAARSGATTAANTASGNTPTLDAISGTITTASLTTVAGATTDITVTNSYCTANSTVLAIVTSSSSAGMPIVARTTASNGSFVVKIGNAGTVALNNTVTFKFIIL